MILINERTKTKVSSNKGTCQKPQNTKRPKCTFAQLTKITVEAALNSELEHH